MERREGLAEAAVRGPNSWVGSPFSDPSSPGWDSLGTEWKQLLSVSLHSFLRSQSSLGGAKVRAEACRLEVELLFLGGGVVGGLCGICWWDVLQGLLFSLPGGNWGLFSSKPPADGALTGCWLWPGLYRWLHLGSVAAESRKEITTPKYEPEPTGLASHIVALTEAVCLYSVTIRWTLTSKQLRISCVLHSSFISL